MKILFESNDDYKVDRGYSCQVSCSDPYDGPVACGPGGAFEGVHNEDGSRSWLGIPYAKPPVGKIRQFNFKFCL